MKKVSRTLGAAALSLALITGVTAPAHAASLPSIPTPTVTVSGVYNALSSEDMSMANRASTLATFSALGLVFMSATTVLITNGYNSLVDAGVLPRVVMPTFLR